MKVKVLQQWLVVVVLDLTTRYSIYVRFFSLHEVKWMII